MFAIPHNSYSGYLSHNLSLTKTNVRTIARQRLHTNAQDVFAIHNVGIYMLPHTLRKH